MKKVVFVFIAMLCIALTGCSYFGELFSCDEPEPQKKTQESGPVRYWSKSYRTVVTYKSTYPGAWHRVYFRIDGRDSDSFENNVDCWYDLRIGDSIYVEENWGGYHYYKIRKINH